MTLDVLAARLEALERRVAQLESGVVGRQQFGSGTQRDAYKQMEELHREGEAIAGRVDIADA